MVPKKILVICPNWVGDVVMATPTFRALRNSFPEAEITGMFRPYVAGILSGASWFDRAWTFDRRRVSLREAVRMARRIRSGDFDLALVLPNSFSSALLARLGGVPERVGYVRDRRRFLLTRPVPRPGEGPGEGGLFRPVYMVDYYLELARAAGAGEHGRHLELFVPEETGERAERLLESLGVDRGEPLIGLNPGASFGSSKCWLPSRFAEAGDRLSEKYKGRCIILAGPGEEAVQAEIAGAMRSDPAAPAPADLPLDVLKGVVRRLALLVTNDTGPRHFASAFRVPAVVLMGPTDPRYTQNESERATVLRVNVPCGPCHLKTCPEDHRCMKAINADMVIEAAEGLLASP